MMLVADDEKDVQRMNIAVVGLGLIGGSFCKALKKYTQHTCLGIGKGLESEEVQQALAAGAIDRAILPQNLGEADLAILCLHPQGIIDFVQQHQHDFRAGSIVIDAGGVKQSIIAAVEPVLAAKGVEFLGAHPMAGREFSGFTYSLPDLFVNHSLIITPTEHTRAETIMIVEQLGRELQFGQVVQATPERHDQIIAFTSQLAHVVSSAYIKSPTLEYESGFSAGSFRDMTRVAKLNEEMWTELFMMNQPALLAEIDSIIDHLNQYRETLAAGDGEQLRQLLRDGRIRKEKSSAGGKF